MLFTQHNGLAQAIGEAEAGAVQEMACTIGPRVDGLAVGRITPQAMGAFSTYGAQAACAGYDQQKEQHTPTTMSHRELGATLAPTASSSPFPTSSTSTQILTRAIALRQEVKPVMATDTSSAPSAPAAATPAPTAAPAAPGTYPPGTITAFNSTTNMWRVAVPVGSTGLGIFSAAATFTEVAPVQAPPNGATQVSQTQFEKQTGTLPIYKKPLFWVAIAGGVAVLGGGSYLLFRRKRV